LLAVVRKSERERLKFNTQKRNGSSLLRPLPVIPTNQDRRYKGVLNFSSPSKILITIRFIA
jgi:hypothetical protein